MKENELKQMNFENGEMKKTNEKLEEEMAEMKHFLDEKERENLELLEKLHAIILKSKSLERNYSVYFEADEKVEKHTKTQHFDKTVQVCFQELERQEISHFISSDFSDPAKNSADCRDFEIELNLEAIKTSDEKKSLDFVLFP
eukprot:Sdes_comp14110_c0_seq1m3385